VAAAGIVGGVGITARGALVAASAGDAFAAAGFKVVGAIATGTGAVDPVEYGFWLWLWWCGKCLGHFDGTGFYFCLFFIRDAGGIWFCHDGLMDYGGFFFIVIVCFDVFGGRFLYDGLFWRRVFFFVFRGGFAGEVGLILAKAFVAVAQVDLNAFFHYGLWLCGQGPAHDKEQEEQEGADEGCPTGRFKILFGFEIVGHRRFATCKVTDFLAENVKDWRLIASVNLGKMLK